MSDYAVRVEGLVKRYGQLVALGGIDLEVPQGTVFGLLGPNGAGKTTAVRILATILKPDGGHAEVLGHDVVKEAPAVRRRIGLAGQYAAVDANLTGRENLRMVGILGQMPTPQIMPRAAELLEKFELIDAADRPLRRIRAACAGGLDIAASLVTRPPVLFLDEPTTGLDLTSRNALWETIEQLVADGTTVMLTTQYLEEADRLAERIAVVDGGLVIANDTPTNLKSQLGSTVVEIRFEKHDGSERAATLLTGNVNGQVERDDGTLRITSNDGARILIDVLRMLDAQRHRARHARGPRTEPGRRVPGADRSPRGGRRGSERATGQGPARRSGMSTAQVTIERDVIDRRIPMGRLRDTSAVIKRNLLQYIRVPQLLVFSTVQPIIFVLMFRFVFGGSINTGKIPYVDYLMPGIFLQVVVFGSLATAIGLATDLKSGLMERFHALPMWTPAVLVGRTLADLLRNFFVVILMMVVGFLVGWRIHTTLLALVPGVLLVLLFGYAMSWIFATIGLAVKDPETAQAAAFPILAPLVFASASFVQVENMPGWLQPWSRNQPVSVTAETFRALTIGGPTQLLVVKAILWSALIIAIFAPIAVRLYRKAV